jgi:hypothetical protein
MAYSQATLISRIRRTLNDVPWYDTCTEAMDTTETGLDVADTTKYSVGDILEFQDDGELCLVTALFSATVLTVVRNFQLSVTATAGTGTSHSISATIAKTPAYQYMQITQAITQVIDGLYPHAYRVVSYTLTPLTDGNKWYELDDGSSDTSVALELSNVVQVVGSGATSYPFWYGTRGKSYPVSLHRDVPAAKAGSRVAVFIPFLRDTTNSIYVETIAPIIDTVGTGNYTYLDSGLPADTVEYLACAVLMRAREVQRTMGEDISMNDESLRPGDRLRTAAYFEQQGTMYLRKWQVLLDRKIPRLGEGTRAFSGRI